MPIREIIFGISISLSIIIIGLRIYFCGKLKKRVETDVNPKSIPNKYIWFKDFDKKWDLETEYRDDFNSKNTYLIFFLSLFFALFIAEQYYAAFASWIFILIGFFETISLSFNYHKSKFGDNFTIISWFNRKGWSLLLLLWVLVGIAIIYCFEYII